jgi:hypothetical protein
VDGGSLAGKGLLDGFIERGLSTLPFRFRRIVV